MARKSRVRGGGGRGRGRRTTDPLFKVVVGPRNNNSQVTFADLFEMDSACFSCRTTGIEKYGQDEEDEFLALDDKSAEDWDLVESLCTNTVDTSCLTIAALDRTVNYHLFGLFVYLVPINHTEPGEEAEHEDEEDEDVMALKPFDDSEGYVKPKKNNKAKGAKGAKASDEESEVDLEPVSNFAFRTHFFCPSLFLPWFLALYYNTCF